MLFSRSNKVNKLADDELIAKYREQGDREVISELFKRYSHLVYGVCLKYLRDEDDSKDAVINIFEKMMEDLKKHEIRYFKSWLYMVVKNHCLMKLRTKQVEVTKDLEFIREDGATMEVVSEDHKRAVDKENSLIRLEQAIDKLKPNQKRCIELFYLREMCYNEVADKTGFTLKQVKSYIQNGKRNLKIILSDSHDNITA